MSAELLPRQLAALIYPLDASARRAVRRGVVEYVDARKAEQWPPERILSEVQRLAEEVDSPSPESEPDHSHLVMEMVVWTIERYYQPIP